MQLSTEYPGLSQHDYDNVLALNTVFLDVTTDFKGPQKGRLAAAPFLLFSLRESDPEWWYRALQSGLQRELLPSAETASREVRGLLTASIGFLWQLARRNPYAARVITGATLAWCELLVEHPLITLLDRVGARGDLLTSRLDDSYNANRTLLEKGASSRRNVRRSSHIVTLQAMLTANRQASTQRLPAAACGLAIPSRATGAVARVSDKKV